jgi:uncharacterized protein YcbX
VINTNQTTGAREHEPLRTLATYRRAADGTAVHFGQNAQPESTQAMLSVGDPVMLL